MVIGNDIGLVKVITGAVPFSQTVLLFTLMEAVMVGLTVMLKVIAGPGHPFAVGVTVIIPVMGALVALLVVNDGIFPEPLAAKPMAVLLLVQVKVVPATGPVRKTGGAVAPEQ